MQLESSNAVYTLRDSDEQRRRHELLKADHIAPLTEYVKQLRTSFGYGQEIPYFDPHDGGIKASLLFLLEAPGPKAVVSGFVSRDNPDPTARNMTQLLAESGVPRRETVSWNIVPWYVGSDGRIRPVNQQEINAGISSLKFLRPLLPNIRVVVLIGRKAQQARLAIEELFQTPVLDCPHPSQRVLNVWPQKREEIKSVFRQAFRLSLGGARSKFSEETKRSQRSIGDSR
jgi:uracil-DNA glycosylase